MSAPRSHPVLVPEVATGLTMRLGRTAPVGAAIALLAGLALALPPWFSPPDTAAPPAGAAHARAAVRALPAGLLAAASKAMGASDHSYWAARRGTELQTRGGGIETTFSAATVRLRTAGGTLSLGAPAFGRIGHLRPAAAVAPRSAGSRLIYAHATVTALYGNGPYGLEQGFILHRRPRAGAGAAVLAMRLSGSLRAEQAGSQIVFRTRAGAVALRYGELSVIDDRGRSLPAAMRRAGGDLQLLIDDRGARYPLRVDPFFQQGSKLTGGEESGGGELGEGVALSADGNTAVVGGPGDNGGVGAAWVFVRSEGSWSQQGPKLTGAEEVGKARFGFRVSVSSDGNTALIGGPVDNSSVGGAWVFVRSEGSWSQQGPKLTGAEEVGSAEFGIGTALSADGNTAMVGALNDNGGVGAAWVFVRSEGSWSQQGAKLTGSGETGKGHFGLRVALSESGDTALIGAGTDNSSAGAAWVFVRSEGSWSQQGAKLTGSGEVGEAHVGYSVALSADGNTALVGGLADSSEAGATWVFVRSGGSWSQQGSKLTGGGEVGRGLFGYSVALSADGNTALIGGRGDNTGVGAAWVFTRSGSTWEQAGTKLTAADASGAGLFGAGVALSSDGTTALVGGPGDNTNAGAAWAFVNIPQPPTVETRPATAVTQSSATLNATVNPQGGLVSDCHFNYGTSPTYGSSAPCTMLPGSSSNPVPVSAELTGLTAETTYHFQIVATNPTGMSEGADGVFTTTNPPEFGRCVKLAKGVKGRFSTAACTTPATSEKFSFEWEPGPGPNAKFTTKIKELTTATIETVGGATRISCSGQSGTGEYTGRHTMGNVVLTLTGCELSASKCTSEGAEEGVIRTSVLDGSLGVQKKSEIFAKDKIALDLFPAAEGSPVMEFTCGGTAVDVSGSVLVPVASNKMALTATLKFLSKSGKQKPENFEGMPADVLMVAVGEGAPVQAGLTLTTLQRSEEKVEINSVI
ncbi:MAG: hypothetical protein E6G34_01755 [Actinobacteria bacterium]|nr:MAG: hypothetical protein E6G34_01755 [Actinomycetota bacterium]